MIEVRRVDTPEEAMDIQFVKFCEIDKAEVIGLMNHDLVQKHMPLIDGVFGEDDYHQFIAAKQALWDEHGYGPWAFLVDGKFAGWGGLQAERGETDLALVLAPEFWGIGKRIFDRIVRFGFEDLELQALTVLLPPSRVRTKGLHRLGFTFDGDVYVSEQRFVRYRLDRG